MFIEINPDKPKPQRGDMFDAMPLLWSYFYFAFDCYKHVAPPGLGKPPTSHRAHLPSCGGRTDGSGK